MGIATSMAGALFATRTGADAEANQIAGVERNLANLQEGARFGANYANSVFTGGHDPVAFEAGLAELNGTGKEISAGNAMNGIMATALGAMEESLEPDKEEIKKEFSVTA